MGGGWGRGWEVGVGGGRRRGREEGVVEGGEGGGRQEAGVGRGKEEMKLKMVYTCTRRWPCD